MNEYGTVPKALRSDGNILFLVSTYSAKISNVPGAPCNVNPSQAITWQLGVTIYCTVFNNNSPPPR